MSFIRTVADCAFGDYYVVDAHHFSAVQVDNLLIPKVAGKEHFAFAPLERQRVQPSSCCPASECALGMILSTRMASM